jgi:hypothetical protein
MAKSKSKPASTKAAAGCMMLFALPFAVTGIGMGGYAWWVASKALDAQSWLETPAVLTSVELKQGKNGSRQAIATYEYEFGGRRYFGDQVSLHRGNDDLGRFQTRAHEELNRHKLKGQPFRAYVNPNDPAESVLYRNVRWEMMAMFCGMAALFGSAGVGIFTASLVTRLRRETTAAGGDSEAKPWERRADWASGRIGPSDAARAAVPATSAVAAWWLLASTPIVATWPIIVKEAGTRWSWLLLLFPVIGVLIVVYAAYLAIRRRRFGESIFEMASVPGVVGGPLRCGANSKSI